MMAVPPPEMRSLVWQHYRRQKHKSRPKRWWQFWRWFTKLPPDPDRVIQDVLLRPSPFLTNPPSKPSTFFWDDDPLVDLSRKLRGSTDANNPTTS